MLSDTVVCTVAEGNELRFDVVFDSTHEALGPEKISGLCEST